MNDLLLRLVRHMRWADTIVADALAAGDRTGGDATRLFAHVAAVEHLWYARITSRKPDHAVWPELSVADARVLAANHADLFEQLIAAADGAALARVVAYRNSAGRDYGNAVSDIVLQATVHGEHHRGQIARLIRAAGGEPPSTDYIQFARRQQ